MPRKMLRKMLRHREKISNGPPKVIILTVLSSFIHYFYFLIYQKTQTLFAVGAAEGVTLVL